jgi:hypothetical protein
LGKIALTRRPNIIYVAHAHRRVGDIGRHRQQRAERLVLALDRLGVALPANPGRAKTNRELDNLFLAVQSLPDFDPLKFAKALQQFAAELSESAAGAGQ